LGGECVEECGSRSAFTHQLPSVDATDHENNILRVRSQRIERAHDRIRRPPTRSRANVLLDVLPRALLAQESAAVVADYDSTRARVVRRLDLGHVGPSEELAARRCRVVGGLRARLERLLELRENVLRPLTRSTVTNELNVSRPRWEGLESRQVRRRACMMYIGLTSSPASPASPFSAPCLAPWPSSAHQTG